MMLMILLTMMMMMMMMTMMTKTIPYRRTKTHIWDKVLMGIWVHPSKSVVIMSDDGDDGGDDDDDSDGDLTIF